MEKSNKNCIFAALESATLPIEQRTRAELFVYMRMEYTNPPLGTATLLANLQNEGLVIMDERKANAFLENVSYFRFAAYLRPFKASDRHGYKKNATFEKAVRLYEFDAKLRTLLFSAIQKIEISLRAKVINQFSLIMELFGLSIPIWLLTSISMQRIFPLWIGNYSVPRMILSKSIM